MTFRRGHRCQRAHTHTHTHKGTGVHVQYNSRCICSPAPPTPCLALPPPHAGPCAHCGSHILPRRGHSRKLSPAPAWPHHSSPSPWARCTLFKASRLSYHTEVTASPWQPSLPLHPPVFPPPLSWQGSVPVVPAPLPWLRAEARLVGEHLGGGDALGW